MREAAPLRVTLDDLYVEIGLPRRAAVHFRRVLDASAGPAVRGPAALAVARFATDRNRAERARELFDIASELLGRAGPIDEQREALRELRQHR